METAKGFKLLAAGESGNKSGKVSVFTADKAGVIKNFGQWQDEGEFFEQDSIFNEVSLPEYSVSDDDSLDSKSFGSFSSDSISSDSITGASINADSTDEISEAESDIDSDLMSIESIETTTYVQEEVEVASAIQSDDTIGTSSTPFGVDDTSSPKSH